ncbi:MAG: hypothetical protein M0D55_18715 [Elusimicrobiota bacterium]|nr:MAG: hypothetical protein M0D55_18715 [Elusimicrobiota bacterium]
MAETVERRKPRKGPVKAVGYVDHGGGAVRYSVEGWSWFVAGRRRDALRRMRRNCGKDHKPRLVDEYLRDDADIAYSGEDVSTSLDKGIDHFKIAPFQHLRYDCVPKGAAEPPAVSTSAPAFLVVPPQGAAPDISTSPAAVEISTAAMIPDISTPTETAP